MDTFWLLSHENMKGENSMSLQLDEILQATTCEPEFLQIIWNIFH